MKNTGFTRVDSIKTEFLDVNYLSKVDFILLDSNKNAFFSKVSKILEIGDMFCFVCKKEKKIVFFDSLGNYVRISLQWYRYSGRMVPRGADAWYRL